MANKHQVDLKNLSCGNLPGVKPVVLISTGAFVKPNIAAVSYFGQVTSKKVFISLRPCRHSYKLIKKNKSFGINFPFASDFAKVDFCGVYSGKSCDKGLKMKYTFFAGSKYSVPLINECAINFECKLSRTMDFNEHTVFVGEVLSAYESTLKPNLLVHNNLDYFKVTKKLGKLFESHKKLGQSYKD